MNNVCGKESNRKPMTKYFKGGFTTYSKSRKTGKITEKTYYWIDKEHLIT